MVGILALGAGVCRAGVGPAPSADPLRLLELRLDGRPTGETLACYASGDDLLVPLGALGQVLGLAIQIDVAERQAHGSVIRPDRALEVDATAGTALVEKKRTHFDPLLVEVHDDDLCVDARLLSTWLPLDIRADSVAGTLDVTSRETFPSEARRLRALRAAQLASSTMQDHPPYPELAPAYRMFSLPIADQEVHALTQNTRAGSSRQIQIRTHAAADLLGCEGHLFLANDAAAGGGPARLSLGRKDEKPRLLGPLHARQFAVGEVFDAGLADLTAAHAGTGVMLSNVPLLRPSEFDRHRFAGVLEPGWEVELYRNGALLAYQPADVAAAYEFDDVPLDYGVNQFELRFYGPQGECRTEREVYNADPDMTRSGSLAYRLLAEAPHGGSPRAALRLDWGLRRRLALGLDLATARFAGTDHAYAEAALRTVQGRVLYEVAAIGDARGGSAGRARAHARWNAVAVNLDHFESYGLTTEASAIRRDARQQRTTLSLRSSLPLPFAPGAPLDVEARPERLRGAQSQDQMVTRVAWHGKWLSLTHEHLSVAMLARGTAGTYASATDRLMASGRLRAVTLRGRLEYDPRVPARSRIAALSLERRRSDGAFAEVGLERRALAGETHLLATLGSPQKICGLTAHVDYGGWKRSAFEVGIRFGLGYEPRSHRWLTAGHPMADQGALSVHAFVDENGNGVADPGEPSVPGAEVLLNSMGGGARTDDAGFLTLTRVPSDQAVDVGLLERSLEDPTWILERPGVRVEPHAGQVTAIEMPVAVTSEISGTAYARTDSVRSPLSGIRLELLDARSGQVVRRTITAYDGFYDLTGVPPGHYRLRAAPSAVARLSGPEPEIEIPPTGTLLDRFDLELVPADPGATH